MHMKHEVIHLSHSLMVKSLKLLLVLALHTTDLDSTPLFGSGSLSQE